MKVIVEKEEASVVEFCPDIDYPVLRDFVNYAMIVTAKISLENGIMYADLNLRINIKGYPAIGYLRVNETGIKLLEAVAICNSPNNDESIESIEYTLQLEGKPSNLKTK